ncbi:hypothetical protein SAMN05660909_05506 [Chitinophaga terrae (ex Kim and Jung 2007)]|uniref:Uncharacterized protein n=1 Tax=Chitinophaga terrae (ex Kim and Jung 2007) TaxID=408074 RepID=A0A1H4GMB3_9BACT|nr:hypothetical protein [Chitinophaga terrae (ex Kim and Jung 2007)]GEP93596.1 hypothetical protein CTE07_52410 [Chitinophaga terrae (ex Kim and Jung 2007)]SEB10647.1 hypothetical protein SAMN05660909_05506 [Chitinophaga terrae (ex Kim and Jung 2007)]
MHIYISEEAIVGDIQDRFHAFYPNLKLIFYRQPHIKGTCNPEEKAISPETPIEKIRMRCCFGWLDISYYRTAQAVEHELSHIFGLNAQILRNTGNSWLETTDIDNLTLEELNNTDRQVNSHATGLPKEPDNH